MVEPGTCYLLLKLTLQILRAFTADVVLETNFEKRVALISKIVDLGIELLHINDLELACATFNALDAQPIHCLHATLDKVRNCNIAYLTF